MTNGDKVLLPLTTAGRQLADGVIAGHPAPQSVSEAVIEVAGVKLLELTIHGKRPGEGVIANDMKGRRK